MKYKVGDKVRVKSELSRDTVGVVSDMLYYKNCVYTIVNISVDGIYYKLDGNEWIWTDEMLEPVSTDNPKFKVGDRVRVKNGFFAHALYDDKQFEIKKYDNSNYTYLCKDIDVGYSAWFKEETLELAYQNYGFKGGKIPTPEKPIPIEKQLGHTFKDSLNNAFDAWRKQGVSVYDLNPVEWHKPMEIKLDISDLDYEELNRRLDDYFKGLKRGVGKSAEITHCDEKAIFKEDKPMKFTYETIEGYRMDKSNNTRVPTITTTVRSGFGDKAIVTCDKTDYDERQGVLEAVAQLYCKGSFDKEYKKAAKKNKECELHDRTCKYCHKVFDTIEEREAHEAWHVERRKARHERYKLRKRAKEIAFEEAARQMAKEMIATDK